MDAHAATDRQPKLGANELVDRALREIEVGLRQDDPEFERRMQRIERADIGNALAVFTLLAASAVLLVIGLATQTLSAWIGGVVALFGSFLVDHHYQRGVERAIGT